MKQAYCQRDIFHAPTDGEIICRGVVQQDVPVGTKCSITCNAAIADPREIACLPSGWDADIARCDATSGGLSPGTQVALICVGLILLCVATFLYQRFRKQKIEENTAKNQTMGHTNASFDPDRTYGMGREGFDNLQAVNAGEISPLPQPKNRPGKGYHPAGQGIHDFMGTCTIGTVSQNPKLGKWTEDPKNLA
ncbi:Oidioi.mRNA.OKI2018_I69.chr1.g517.t1.cds [Oikopleura dioica]|uniref:Oidioi.mRNA.OKI2018_I69.chr1.g517.t1.cds n=1 Tax=Oikopleura dioica TaxID=34765 RepID=A0ABN7SK42_OIKDI|nr:Oidioi.mRNA.OKI2018_I69.chr1.g517.t1.cds [Oikopleura dioica]